MATEYTITYTYTGQSNTSGTRSVAFNKFKASGDTGRNIGQITSIQYIHHHTSDSPMTWNLKGRLVFGDGTTIKSPNIGIHISGDVAKYTHTFTTLPTAEQFATLTSVQTLDSQGKTTSGGYSSKLYWRATSSYPMQLIVKFIEQPPVTYAPSIASFVLQRCDSNAALNDEGQYIATTLKLAIGDTAGLTGAQCRIYYAANEYPVVGESQYVDITSKISTLMTGVNRSTSILTGVWGLGYQWHFAVVFITGDESAIATFSVARGSTSLHISGEHGGGVAIGGFSSGTTANPKFESVVPAYFHGGIAKVEDCSGSRKALGIQSGRTTATVEAAPNTYKDYNFTFPTAFASAPLVFVCFETTSTAAGMGSISVVVSARSATGFTARVYNNTGTDRWPSICWFAVGEM